MSLPPPIDAWAAGATRPSVTTSVTRGASRYLRQCGCAVVSEMTFANGRRADLVAIWPDHSIWIIEVKSGLADFRVDLKWPDYASYADALCFAVAPDFPAALLPAEVGLMIADGYGAGLVRNPARTNLTPARRKAIMLSFARLASDRLARLQDPGFEPGS